jgi:hypothetical protein
MKERVDLLSSSPMEEERNCCFGGDGLHWFKDNLLHLCGHGRHIQRVCQTGFPGKTTWFF